MNTYTPPEVRDYGTLLELTADLDVNLVGITTNLVMAAISGPTGGGPGGTPDNTVLTPGPGGGGGTVTADGPTGNGGGVNPGDAGEVADRDASGGTGSGGGGAGGGGGGLVGAPVGEQKKLPFTGFPILLAAGVGAALTSAGVALRSKLRRRPGEPG